MNQQTNQKPIQTDPKNPFANSQAKKVQDLFEVEEVEEAG